MLKLDPDAYLTADHGLPTMVDLLRMRALHQGGRLAYTFLADGEAEKIELTYGELDQRSRAIGAALQLVGAAGERVLLLYPPGVEFIAAFLGCFYAGAVAVPAYPPRLNRSQVRLQNIIDDTRAAVALTTSSVLVRAERLINEQSYAKGIKWLATDDITNELGEKWREPAVDCDSLAMIQYTSGSTSVPKGVMVSHRNLLVNERMIQEAFRQNENSVIVGWLPLYHDMGLIGNVLQPLYLGARCVLMSPMSFLQKPSRWLQAISDYRATTSGGPNFAYDLCVRKIGLDERASFDLSNWTTAFNGSEPIFSETMERFAAAFADCGFRREAFYPCYGLAEATLLVAAGPNNTRARDDKEVIGQAHLMSSANHNGQRARVGCGKVLPNERVVIVDPESLIQCPVETVGEIWISGPNVARGYWNRDQETEQTFGAYLGGAGEGPFLRTGDLGYIKNGELFVTGRIKDLIIIRGRNHYPQDIELTVQHSVSALESGSCAAFSIEQANEERLVIVKELSRSVPDPGSIIECIREAVAREHEIQSHAIVLIDKGSLPKTTSGKIQRYECRNQYQSDKLATIAEWRENLTPGAETVSSPSTHKLSTVDAIAIEAIQNSLLSFLAAKLGRNAEHIDADKPLLRYGVDSLTAIELTHHLESRFGVVFPTASLLEDVTVAQLTHKALDQMKGGERDSRPSLKPVRNEATEHPLSYGQRSLWFLYQLAPLNGAYNVSSAVRIRSAIDIEALRRALRKIVDRHDSLRSAFFSSNGEPLQKVYEKSDISLIETDASSWSDEFLNDHLAREAHRPFNLEQSPLLRASLFIRSPREYILLVVAHHIVVDLWSMGVLAHELSIFYKAEVDHTAAPLAPLPVQYLDYVYRQKALLDTQEGERLYSYWQNKLAGDLGGLDLPADRPRPPLQTFKGASQPIYLSTDITRSIESLGQNHKATPYVVLQAVFHALIHRYTAQDDLLIGSPVAGRSDADLAGLVGYFVNPVVLRADLSGNPTFSGFLDRVREMTLSALTHQNYPFALLVERLQPAHDPSRSPIFQVMFALQKTPSLSEEGLASNALVEGERLSFGGLSAESVAIPRRASYFDLSLFLVETNAGLKGFIEYNTDLFDEWRIRRMAEHFRTLVQAATTNPERRIHELELMSAEEKEQVIVEFNRTERNYDTQLCIHELIEAQAEIKGEDIAVVCEEERASYGELNRRANQVAGCLIRRGVGCEDRVGICVERGIDMVVGIVGILKAGAAYVPLDPSYPRERLEYMLEDASVKALLTQERLKEIFGAQGSEAICLDSDWPRIAREEGENPGRKAGPENLAYVIYTSGSTGKPKGVAITHRSAVTLLKWSVEEFSDREMEGVLASTSICFDLSVFELMVPLSRGGKVVVAENALSLPELMAAGEVRLVNTVPSAMRELVGRQGIPESVETVNLAGEALRNDLAQQIYERGEVRRVVNLYGPTEDTTYTTWGDVVRGAEEEPTLGRPISNTEVYILDQELCATPIGIYGEIYISGEGLARCYLDRPETTAERFLPNRFGRKDGGRLYRTGDIGRYGIDGSIEYQGRADHQVKVRGYRIELGEIERALEEKEWVREAVVVAREESEGDKRIVAYVAPEPGREGEVAGLRKYLKEKLPEYMTPSAIVALDKMPLTPNGKLDRKALPAPDSSAYIAREYESPVGESEVALARIWAEVLRLERVGRNDHFFELGGHSLLAVRLIERMRSEGLHTDVRGLFSNPTVAALAAAIGGESDMVEVPPSRIPFGCEAIKPEMLPLAHLSADDIERIVSAAPGGAANVQDIYPLAPLQEGILFHHQMSPEGDMYLMRGLLSFDTRTRMEGFLQALQAVIERHDLLRTAVFWEELPEPVQVVYRRAQLEVEEVNVDPTVSDVADELYSRFDPRRYRLDVRLAPLMRVCFAYDGRHDRWVALHLVHHLVMDHTTLEVLLREIQAHLSGQAEQLLAPLPFRNFVAQARLAVSREEHEAFFRGMLGDVDEPTAPFGLINAQGAGPDLREARREVDTRLANRLRQESRALGVSAASLYHLAWAQVLARVSGRDDVIFGTILLGRMQGGEGADRVLGMFINTLPIRIRIGGASLRESVMRTHTLLAELLRHQHAPLALAQRCSAVEAPAPLFSALLNYRHSAADGITAGAAERSLPAWDGIEILATEERTNYPLTLIVDDLGEGFALTAQAQSPIDPDRICAYMHTALETLIEKLESASTTPVSRLDVLPHSERRQLLVEWNATETGYPSHPCVHELFEVRAADNPEAVAVTYEDIQLTYGELNAQADRLAHYLSAIGVRPDARVALSVERSLEMIVGLLGILKAGGAYVPLDPTYPAERLAYMLEDSAPVVVLTHTQAPAEIRSALAKAGVPMIDLEADAGRWANEAGASRDKSAVGVTPEHLAYVIYTSGSTGRPKGVMNEHRGVVNRLLWMQDAYGLTEDDVALQKTPFGFDVSVWEFFWPLLNGAKLVMARPEGHKDPVYLTRVIEQEGITTLHFVPSMLQVFLESGEAARCSSLVRVICSGESLPEPLVRRFRQRLSAARLYNLYGPTEAAVDVTAWDCGADIGQESIPIGRPIANTQIYILDGDVEPAPIGVAGEIHIGGVQVARGYLNRAELTAERFVACPFGGDGNSRMYKTGDLGRYLPDGNIEYLGRNDFQVKIRGFRIEMGEIETRLAQHPAIREAVVLAREDNSGALRLVAYYTRTTAEDSAVKADAESLRAHLLATLPEYMAPAEYVALDALPTTPNGKLDRNALPEPGRDRGESEVVDTSSRTPVEEILAGTFAEVLGLDQVGTRDNFFELGGHSLSATQVISRVMKTFGAEISVRAIFEEATVEGLASRIERAISKGEKDEAPPLVKVARDSQMEVRAPLSFAQQRLWFLDQLAPNNPFYNISAAVSLEGKLDLGTLERSVNEIIRRHEALRTKIVVEAGAPVQVIEEWVQRRLEVEDLTSLAEDEREEKARVAMKAEAGTGFDLARGPLLRARALKLEEEKHLALFTMHHIVSDGWSMGVLAREVCELYEAMSEGREASLPELEIQYADYVVWQRNYLDGKLLDGEVGYWKKQLKDAAVMELPTDRARPPAPSYRGARERVEIGNPLSEGLRRLCRREGATTFMTLMAAFKVVLMRYSGEEDISVGTVIANRTRKELEGLIGFFANTLVMRTDLGGNPSFRELIDREREVCLGAYGRQEAPFEKLVEEINPDRDLSRSPLFQVMMALQNVGREELKIKGLKVCEIEGETGAAKFDLMLTLTEGEEGFVGSLEYSLDLYDGETIRRMARHCENVLAEVVRDASQRIRELELMSAEEKEQVIVEFNRTERNYDTQLCIHELIEAQAEIKGEDIAVVCEEERSSYGELNRRANQVAGCLIRRGVGCEDRVGICVERGIDMVVGIVGILKAGAAYVPLDPSYPRERLEYMLEDASVKALLTQERLKEIFGAQGSEAICLDSDWPRIAREEGENPGRKAGPENLAYVIYTSGSTGKPKGVAITHRSAVTLLKWSVEEFSDREMEGVLASTSICFDLSVFELMVPLSRGGKVVVAENALSLPELMAAGEVRLVNTVPSAMRELVGRQGIPRSVETVNLAGEALRNDLAQQIYECGEVRRVVNLYGPTEDTTYTTWGDVVRGAEEEPTLGRPISNTEVYILDQELCATPIGIYGEIYISGEGLARCYLDRPETTAERFLPNRFGRKDGGRLYRTGDIGRYGIDGSIEYQGRADHQVKVRGYRIELGEIERALEEKEWVREAVVVAREESEGDKRIVAYVVTEEGREGEAAGLRKYLKEKLPEYMTPSAIVALEKMPLTPNGKLDRKALPNPARRLVDVETANELGRTPVEEILVGIFQEVLRHDRVSVHDNFFELGGHSLLATRVISRIRNTFEVEIGVRSIFEDPTVKGLALRIGEAIGGEEKKALPLIRTAREGQKGVRAPLSFAQQRLWFLNQLAPNNPFYNCPGSVRLEGRLDLEALEGAINEIVRRHEVLRTRIEVEEGVPAQVIDVWEPRRLWVESLNGLEAREREEEARRITKEEAETGFDLSRGPLLRVKALKLGDEEHVLLFTMHHIVSDGWSMEILVKEVGALYRAYSAGESSPLEELPIQYADFAVWQRAWLQGEPLERELEYWRNQLAGMEALELPTDHPRPAARTYRGAVHRFVVESEVAEKLRGLSQREGVTLFMTLLGGFDLLMSRYSGQREVVVGTDIANRNRAEIEGLIGFFVNQLVLRVEVRDAESFRELLKRVREVCLGAYAHQDVPFEKLVEELQPERDLGRSPLFQVKLILQNAPREGLELQGLKLLDIGGGEAQTTRSDLTAAITDAGYSLIGAVNYSRDLFEPETIERLMGHYVNALKWIAQNVETPVSEMSLLSDEEREQILLTWNQTARPYPNDLSIHELFTRQAERTPERMALVSGGQGLSYGELNRRANQLAHYLQRLGVGPEVVVGVCLERSVEMLVAVMGALKAGGAYLPLDPESPLERLGYMLEDAGAVVALTKRGLEQRLPSFWGQTVCLDEEWERIDEESDIEPESGVVADNLAYVIYTSGSTGRPKGVMVRHLSLANYTHDICRQLGLTEGVGEVGLGFATVSTITADLGNTCIYPSLVSGGCLHVLSYEEATDGKRFEDYLKTHPIDVLKIVPSHLGALLGTRANGERELPNRYLIFGGEALSYELLERVRERGEGCEVINHYGPTETTVGSLTWKVNEKDGGPKGSGSVPIGRPIGNTEVYILDRELRPAPVGVRGELYIGGCGVARGYRGKPDLTAERFVPRAQGGERVYRTGDVCLYLADGKIEFVGRSDDQVKVRGYRIELGEIEAVLNERRTVKQSVVLAKDDGRGGKRLIGYVVGEGIGTAAELKRHVRERLPEYMVPEVIHALEEMPITANGKVDRKRLSMMEDEGVEEKREIVGPRTAIEEIVVGIVEDVLKAEEVGVRENFFEIGGHSLLATQVISRVRGAFGVEIGVGSMFEDPTVEGLAVRIEDAIRAGENGEAPPPVRVSGEGQKGVRLPLSFAQQRLWFLDQLAPNNPFYNVPRAVRLEGRLDLGALESVINEIVRRHEVLRTRIEVEESEPVQVVEEWEPRKLEVEDLTGWAPKEREEEARRITREEAETGFDLSRGPLLRVKALKLGDEEHVLLFTMHHVVSDAWSAGILIREVGALYRAYLAGESSPLEELPIQYADFAVWQRAWLQGEPLERELEYWRRQLAGMKSLDLPTDHPRPAARTYRGARHRFVVESEIAEKLRGLSQREGVTLFMTLLGGFDLLMSRYSGQQEVVVGTDIANRNRAEIEGLIGFFVNQLVLRVEVNSTESFRELLKRVREVCLGAYAHQDVPFERLVEELQPERDLGRSPLFQVKLLLQDAPREGLELQGLRLLEIGGGEAETSRLDLTAAITDARSDLIGVVEYSRDLFEPETIERLMGHYVNALKGIAEDVERPVSELSLLSEHEREQILLTWNQTARPYPNDLSIHELFRRQAERTPERMALIGEGQRVSYGELNRRANQLAHYLQSLGVGPEVLVGVCLERSVEMVVAVMGALKAGGAYLPLDPAYPLERLSFMLEDAGVGVTLTERGLEERLPSFWGQTVCLDEEWERIGEESGTEPESEVVADNLAYVIYTSGSTGRPKGVMVEHRGLCNLAEAQKEAFRLEERSCVLQFASFSFDASVSEIFSTLTAGGSLHVYARESTMPGDGLERILREEKITTVTLPPTVLAALREEEALDLQTVIAAGEACTVEIVERWARGRRFLNAYGPTEATVCASIGECEAGSGKEPTIGRPIANTRLYILDRQMEPAPVGVRGDLFISGVGLARGYLGRPDLTAERFIPNHFSCEAGARLYQAGDIVRYLSDGNIEFIGRADEQVKIRGYRIEPAEIEAVLCDQPGVRQAAVVAREDESGQKRLVAYVVVDLMTGGNNAAQSGARSEIELWPSVAEYFVYDDALYYAMTHDERRNLSYRAAINHAVRDKVALDIGTGADAILARLCVEAGAKKVYAIELLEETYQRAKTLLSKLGLDNQIELIHGDSTKVQLPEGVDVCVSEIVGSIGGCEGAGRILNDARRFLKSSGTMIPCRSATMIAAARLPEILRSKPRFSFTSGYYAEKIFEQLGYPFDLRLCVKNFPTDHVISDEAVFEDLDFNQVIIDEESHEISLTITEHSILDGFLVWLTLHTMPGEVIDILKSPNSWLPVFFPVFYPGLEVWPGDTIKAVCSRRLCAENRINPDYEIEGQVIRRNGADISFCYQSPHFQKSFKSNQFYQELFGGGSAVQINDNRAAKSVSAEFRKVIEERLPNYMAPSAIVLLDRLPLTLNGKLDRQALPAPDFGRVAIEGGYVGARTPVEEIVVGIFEEVLKLDRVGIRSGFFDLGGHSLLATRVISRVRNTFGVEIEVGSLFEEPTVEGLARRIEGAMSAGEMKAPPLVRASRDGRGGVRLPLSFAQQRLWFIDQLEPGITLYNVPGVVRLQGSLNLEALERSVNEIVRRHEVLRTRIESEAGAPVQVIDEWKPRRLEVEDLSGLTPEEREEEVGRIAREEAGTGFDLSRGPLLRVKALKLGDEEHVLLFTMHHIVSDGWSKGVLIGEMGALYQAYSAGGPSPLSEMEIQYADYAVWQRDWLQGEALEKQLAYWKRQLTGAPSLLQLPVDHPRPAVPTYRGAYERFVLSRDLSDQLKTLSRGEGVTLFMSLLAGFQLLLARYSGDERVAVGSPIAGRNRKEIEGLIGFFVNTLVMVTDVSGNPTVRGLLRRVREMAIGAFAHQELPFEKLVEEAQPERSLNRHSLFQVMFAFQNYVEEPPAISNLKVTEERNEVNITGFDITLTVVEERDQITGVVEYARDLYERESILRMLGHLTRLYEGLAADRDCRVLDVPMLTGEEWEQVLAWNRTAVEYAEGKCVHELFEEQAYRAPDRIAGIDELGVISYGELNRRANQLGNYLRRRGVGAEVQVGICLGRGPDLLVGMLGILKAGGAYVPLDPTYPTERLTFMLEDASVRLIVTQEKLRGVLGSGQAELICIDSDRGEVVQESEENIESGVSGENLTYVIYTSGSTGRPKGTMLTHQSVVNLVRESVGKFRLDQDSRFLQFASLSFDVAVEEIYPVLSIGGAVVLQSDNLMYSYSDLSKTIERHGVTTIELPTAYWREWMRELLSADGGAPRCLDLVITGDEKITANVFREWKAHDVSLLHVYGVTEAAVNSIVYPVPEDFGEGGGHAAIPIGKPIANTEVYILDGGLQPTPIRIPNEMYLGGIGLARGYLNQPGLTAARFIPAPFGTQAGSRLYKSGDLARFLPDGRIEFVGRIDHQLKIRGHRVEPAEIESVLMQVSSVKECVVIAREDEPGDKRLVAYLVLKEGRAETPQGLRRLLKQMLPTYLVPSSFVILESLPLSPHGKVDRRALPAPSKDHVELGDSYISPCTPIEEDVAGIFRDVLRVEDVGIYDDFFDLGGHSLLVTQVISRVNSAFQIEMPIRVLFDTPTVSGLVAAIVESQAGQFEDEDLSQMLADLEELAEDEVDAAFNR